MQTSKIMTLIQKLMENMESRHKLILGICIAVCITIIILWKAYISSTTELKREQILINAGQSRYQQTVVREYVVSDQQPIIKSSDVNSNDVTVEIKPSLVRVSRKNQVYDNCHNDETTNTMTIIEINTY